MGAMILIDLSVVVTTASLFRYGSNGLRYMILSSVSVSAWLVVCMFVSSYFYAQHKT